MLFSKCAMCDSKKTKFVIQQKGSGLLSSSGIRMPLRKIPLLHPSVF